MAVSPDEPDLTTSQVARLLRASQSAVIQWANDNLLPSSRTPGGHRRFRREDVDAFLKGREPAA